MKDLPTGVDAIWDLGMGSMNQDPKAWVLQGRSVGESGISLSNLLKDFLDVGETQRGTLTIPARGLVSRDARSRSAFEDL